MRVFLSLPMNGKTDEEINAELCKMEEWAITEFGPDEELHFVHNQFCPLKPAMQAPVKNEALLYLGEAIKKLAYCDAIIYHPDWESARGCRAEAGVAFDYGIADYYIDRADFCGEDDGMGN